MLAHAQLLLVSFILLQNTLLLPGPLHPHTSASSSPLAVLYGLTLCAPWLLSLQSPCCCPATTLNNFPVPGDKLSCLLISKICSKLSILFKMYLQLPPQTHNHFSRNIYYLRANKWSLSSFQFSSSLLLSQFLLPGTKPLLKYYNAIYILLVITSYSSSSPTPNSWGTFFLPIHISNPSTLSFSTHLTLFQSSPRPVFCQCLAIGATMVVKLITSITNINDQVHLLH